MSFYHLLKRCPEKLFVYILRLLAGKFGPICTEFPLTIFSTKILKEVHIKFPQILYKQHLVQFFVPISNHFSSNYWQICLKQPFACENYNSIFPLVKTGFGFFFHEMLYTLLLHYKQHGQLYTIFMKISS